MKAQLSFPDELRVGVEDALDVPYITFEWGGVLAPVQVAIEPERVDTDGNRFRLTVHDLAENGGSITIYFRKGGGMEFDYDG